MKARRPQMFVVGRIMLTMLQRRSRDFVLRLFRENVIGTNRLNIAVRLSYYLFSPMILLEDLFSSRHCADNLEKAVQNFTPQSLQKLLCFVAENSRRPEVVLERMKEVECFRENYEVNIAESRWSEEAVRNFVRFVCEKVGIEVPREAKLLFLRIRLDVELATYARGETEIYDFVQIVESG